MIDCIAGYHLNPWTCGIAKFNAILAKHLDVAVVGIRAVELGSYRRPLLSLKMSEFTAADAADLDVWSQAHTRAVRAVPARLRRHGRRAAAGRGGRAGLLRQRRAVPRPAPGAAGHPGAVLPGHDPEPAAVPADRPVGVHLRHGAQDPRAALPPAARPAGGHRARATRSTSRRRCTRTRASTARSSSGSRSCSRSSTGRSTSWATCPTRRSSTTCMDCTYLAAFFEKGLRANNTTVNAAMECGCAVITNLDEHSPAGLVHMKNVIDINLCDRLPGIGADAAHRSRGARDRARRVRMGPAGRAAARRSCRT